ncbi:FliH/SctL family protein [uncultured Rhodospira sp.]|uniref:FliH/SctL family protein n=1 Tax=uncultured Rhodospira sp. TaxID=1936189 RepID=UPI00260AA369|nr:FliH/SctL family protein [uncultured Rhodospira sp.]
MVSVEKFLFDRSFDEPNFGRRRASASLAKARADENPGKPAAASNDSETGEYSGLDRRRRSSDEPATPPPNMYTEAQVEAAREEGYIRGHTEALEEAAKTDTHAHALAVKAIAEAINRMDEAQRAHNARLEQQAIRLALVITRRILPATGERTAAEEIEHLVSTIMPELADQPRLVVRVHGAIAETVREAVRDLQASSGYEGRIVVRPDNALDRADCRLEWGDGGIERDTARSWSEIEAAVERQLGETVPPAPEASEPNPDPHPTTKPNADLAPPLEVPPKHRGAVTDGAVTDDA